MHDSDPYIRATALIGFADVVTAAGGDHLALLQQAGLPPEALQDPDSLISYRRLAVLLECAASELARPSFGLEWTLATPPYFPNTGPLIMLAHFSNNLREWLDMGFRYWTLHTNGNSVQLIDDGESPHVALRYIAHSYAFPARQLTEYMVSTAVMMGRKVSGITDEHPAMVRFRHRPPPDLSLHEEIFHCPIEFDADHDELVFDRKYLEYKTSGNLTLFRPLLGLYVRHRISQMKVYDYSMATTVALAIPSVIGTGACNIESIARLLGINTKKLQRALAKEGVSFSDILDNVRENMARRLLTDSNAPVARIARLLDYSGNAPFTLAVRRWTGVSPLVFRRQERERLAQQDQRHRQSPVQAQPAGERGRAEAEQQ